MMRVPALCVLTALALAFGLGACTPMQWQHPEYGTSRLHADLAACDHAAFEESWRMAYTEPTFAVPHIDLLPNGQRVYEPGPVFPNAPYADTGELRNFCMRAKGYQLVPVPDADAK